MAQLILENIRATYGKKEILSGISFSVRAGDCLAVIGPNGAGKSTLLKSVIGHVWVQSGRIIFDGVDIVAEAPYKRTSRGVGCFMQGGRIFPNLTVRDNLHVAAGRVADERLIQLIDGFGSLPELIASLLNKRAGLLSGGQRQSLALAMVLARKPHLVLLDEPLAGLSPQMAAETIALVRQINRDAGITVIVVEQNIPDALGLANRAALLMNGKMAKLTDNPSELLEQSTLEDAFLGLASQHEGN